jgi:hypothetical protein
MNVLWHPGCLTCLLRFSSGLALRGKQLLTQRLESCDEAAEDTPRLSVFQLAEVQQRFLS